MNAPELQKIIDWLIDGARSAPSPTPDNGGNRRTPGEGRLAALARRRLRPHPSPGYFGRSFVWRRGAEVVMGSANFDVRDSDEYRSSPLSVLYSTEKEVRRRLSDSAAIDNSPVPRRHARGGRDRLPRVSPALYRRLNPFGELDHETAWRLYGRS